MSGTSRLWALFVLAVLAGPAWAQEERPTLSLSIEDAVKKALESNADIAVQRFAPAFSDAAIRATKGAYDPLATAQLNQNSQTSPASSAFSGGAKVDTKTFNYNFGLSDLLMTGATVKVTFNNTRQSTTSVFALYSPLYTSGLTASVTQPLLRNLSSDISREQLYLAKKNKEIADVQFQQVILTTVASVKQIYYNYVEALDNLDAAKKSLGLAQKLLDENQIKLKVGTMAPLDIVEAQSEVAIREQGLITAEAAITDAEDSLKSAIFPRNDPETWKLRIVPTDRPSADAPTMDIDAALQTALAKRTDVLAAKKNVDLFDISLKYAKNQALPQLDLVASYGTSGLGGTQLQRQGLGGPVVNTIPGGYGDSLSQTFSTDFPSWTVGVNFSYAIGNRAASGARAQAQVNRDQAEAVLRRLELQVATEVRAAGRSVLTAYKSLQAAKATRLLQNQRLDAEEKKFAAGMSTSFLVTQAQRDLANSEASEIQALANYRNSIVNFERAQVAGLVSAGSGLVLTSGALSSSSGAVGSSSTAISLPTASATTTATTTP